MQMGAVGMSLFVCLFVKRKKLLAGTCFTGRISATLRVTAANHAMLKTTTNRVSYASLAGLELTLLEP